MDFEHFRQSYGKAFGNRFRMYWNKFKLFSNTQHGFRELCSTETAMFQYVKCINKELDGGGHVPDLFYDLSRAFDTISVGFMVDKPLQMGIGGNLLDWLQSFMSHRKLNVTIGGYRSAD